MKSTYQIVKDGLLKAQADHAELELGKAGDMRVGNSGAVLPDGSVLGKCARLTYLRLVGVEAEGDCFSKELMFAAGRTNEDSWVEMLVSGGVHPEDLLREEEIPVKWELTHAPVPRVNALGIELERTETDVTGRPDIVLVEWDAMQADYLRAVLQQYRYNVLMSSGVGIQDAQDALAEWVWRQVEAGTLRLKKVLELKLVCSIWQARRVAFQNQPQADHLMQGAHYLWKLAERILKARGPSASADASEASLRAELWYASRVNYPIAYGKQQSMFPKQGEPGSECIQYGDDGAAFSTIPFIVGYELKWNGEGVLEYRRLGDAPGMWYETLITKVGIERYYRTVAEMPVTKVLPPRPLKVNSLGEKMSSSACSYCALKNVCDKREKAGLDEWVDAVKSWVPKLPQTGSIYIKEKDSE